jgi:hypothetical protein
MSYYGRPAQAGMENHGKPWKQEERSELLEDIKRNKSYNEIAGSHKRSIGSIIAKLRSISAELYIDEKKTIDQCIEVTGLDKVDIIDAINKREYNDRLKSKNLENKERVSWDVIKRNLWIK